MTAFTVGAGEGNILLVLELALGGDVAATVKRTDKRGMIVISCLKKSHSAETLVWGITLFLYLYLTLTLRSPRDLR